MGFSTPPGGVFCGVPKREASLPTKATTSQKMLGPVIHKQRRGLNPRMIDFMISWSSISMDFMIYLAFIERYVRSFLAKMLLVRVGGALQVEKKVVSKEHVQMPHEQSLAIWASVKELSQCKCNVIKYTSPTDPIGYRWQKPVNPSAFCSRSHPLTRGPVAASSLLYNRVESHRIKARDPFFFGRGWVNGIHLVYVNLEDSSGLHFHFLWSLWVVVETPKIHLFCWRNQIAQNSNS